MVLLQQRSSRVSVVHIVASLFSFIGRHLLASLISVALPVVLVIITYLILFVVAVFTNSGLGSPVALPLWAIFTFVGSIVYTVILLFPAVALAETISQPLGKWQHIAQIPLSTLFLALLVGGLVALIGIVNQSHLSLNQWLNCSFVAFLVLAIPLGIYWWTMKFTQTILFVITTAIKWIGQKILGKAFGA